MTNEKTMRTREEHIKYIQDRTEDLSIGRSYPQFPEVQDWLIEAEERGVAEQQQKDTEIDKDRLADLIDRLADLIEGMEVSVDVSTCEEDAGHRLFGTACGRCQRCADACLITHQPTPDTRREVISKDNKQEAVKHQRYNEEYGWVDTPLEDLPFYEARGYTTRALYPHSANVTALEARIKELEEGDAARFSWLANNRLIYYGVPGFAQESGRSPEKYKADLRKAIDAAMKHIEGDKR
jgi:hypothetical protein